MPLLAVLRNSMMISLPEGDIFKQQIQPREGRLLLYIVAYNAYA